MNLSFLLEKTIRTTKPHLLKLLKMEVTTVQDLLEFYPRAVESAEITSSFQNIRLGIKNTVSGTLTDVRGEKTARGKKIAKAALILDDSSIIDVIWFQIPYILRNMKDESRVFLVGKIDRSYGKIQILNPELHLNKNVHVGGVRAIYPESPPITSKWLREKIAGLLLFAKEFSEILPAQIIKEENFLGKYEAVKTIHTPQSVEEWDRARERLGFEEVFEIQTRVLQEKFIREKEATNPYHTLLDAEQVKKDLKRASFELTIAQKKCLFQVFKDFERDRPAHRLMQGDVGSGKTIVAFLASLPILRMGAQVAFLAPTEILAKQHFANALQFFGSDEDNPPLSPLVRGEDTGNEKFDFIPYNSDLTPFAQEMRNNPTDSEAQAWKILQSAGFKDIKITRQKPLLGFIADFYCADQMKVIEIDGNVHKEQKEYDEIRDEALEEYGIQVLHITNDEILNTPKDAKNKMKKFLLSPPDKGDLGGLYRHKNIALLTGSLTPKQKKEIKKDLKNGDIKVLIGTHAILTEDTVFKNLGFAVIDEQHRFGVKQRALLAKNHTHVLAMTATPIPRTLALTIYGDQDLSVIDELPPGRQPIITKVIADERMIQKCNYFIDDQIGKNRQIFWVCPLIDESDNIEAKNVKAEFNRISNEVFPKRRVEFLHGKMKPKEKDGVMTRFKNKEFDILVSTSVIEVGVDIPDATVMVIENSERFGLAQLHQFRGRIGRNDMQSYCFLMVGKKNDAQKERLKAMEKSTDGLYLSEIDLKLRGMGQIYGLRQAGLPDMKCADLSNLELLQKARDWAITILKEDITLKKYPVLKKRVEEGEVYF